AVVAELALAALAVLAGSIFAAVNRALGPSEDVLPHAAVKLIFGAGALRHGRSPICFHLCPESHRQLLDWRDHRFTGHAGSIAKARAYRKAAESSTAISDGGQRESLSSNPVRRSKPLENLFLPCRMRCWIHRRHRGHRCRSHHDTHGVSTGCR